MLATRAFFGSAQHTSNPGLLDIPGWEKLPLTEAAARVQRPREDLRAEYARWEAVAGVIALAVTIAYIAACSGSIISSTSCCDPSNAVFTASSNHVIPGFRTWIVPNR